jgi:site-specific DNA-methyltransferase (adenine-specific)
MLSLPAPYYEREGITIYHADCREILAALPMPDLLLTDPPYGIDYRTSSSRSTWPVSNDFAPVHGDDTPFDPAHLLAYACCPVRCEPLRRQAAGVAVMDGVGQTRRPHQQTRLVGFNVSADCEMAWTNLGGPARLISPRWKVMMKGTGETSRVHPTQKPVALMARIISWRTRNPAISCMTRTWAPDRLSSLPRTLGRRAIGIEIEERYCEIAAKRLSQDVLPPFGDVA